MANYIVFITSMPVKSYESANILQWELMTNPEFENFICPIYSCENKQDFKDRISFLESRLNCGDQLTLHIYAHGDIVGIAFKNLLTDNQDEKDYILWDELIETLIPLNKEIDNKLILILQSCYSSNLGNHPSIKKACANLIAGEELIYSRESQILLSEYYKNYRISFDGYVSYQKMIHKDYYDVFKKKIELKTKFVYF